MVRSPEAVLRLIPFLALVPILGLVPGCASPAPSATQYDFFAQAHSESDSDPWFDKVEVWQSRAQGQGRMTVPGVEEAPFRSGSLQTEIGAFKAEKRRELARMINGWSQIRARKYYRFDVDSDPANDYWPTIQELLEKNGDDCDGLDLISYQLLREFGFDAGRIFRVIVRRDRDGVNHMVTLWFEAPDDPWILDATGAFTLTMKRFSETDGWTPTKMFNETRQFRVVERQAGGFALGRE